LNGPKKKILKKLKGLLHSPQRLHETPCSRVGVAIERRPRDFIRSTLLATSFQACNQQQPCFQGPTAILQYEQREKVQFLASTHQHRHRRLQSCVGVALSLARGNSAPATTHAACRGALMAEPRNPPASARECRCFRTRRSRQDSHYDQTPLVSLQRGSACCRIPRN